MDLWVASSTFVGLVVGGLVTFLSTRAQLRVEAAHAYDRSLRDLRLPHYQALFHLTESLPREWGAPGAPHRAELLTIRQNFHAWYFSDVAGGLFLSQAAREAYFAVANELQSVAGSLADDSAALDEPSSRSLRAKASALRHQLAADLGVAEQARHGWMSPRSIAPPNTGP
jgi:hypothetical protein